MEVREMLAFQVTISEAANDRYEGRAGAHDDLVLDVALAGWGAEHIPSARGYTF